MAKKRQEEPPKGSPAWMSTFSDLMNLLLCFFVLLFSMSTVDAQKFEAVAASFSQTFSIFEAGATAIGDGILISNGVSQLNELDKYINSTGKSADTDTQSDALEAYQAASMEQAEQMAENIEESLQEDHGEYNSDISVDFTSQYVSLNLNGAFLFDSGSDQIREEAKPLLASEILDMIAEKQPGFNITKTMILNFGKLLKRNSVPNKRTMRGTCYYVEEVDG